ncbi:hypothetical protein RHMOL_Rhmol05G0291600 [Rhododendron molle]|uniref:Uncharacterized protein n=1 Tax=Rhododendron molle TaxID=49168 RepID=A0ACC0NU32_RHOML|nr:hypothetical protein RHMOL_Rhmol05G0291600 [Rhododendron molle]
MSKQVLLPRGEDGIKGSCRQKPEDPIFGSILTANTVQLDLLLLENQIPFFVLERLFRLTVDQIQIGTNCPRKFSLADYVSFYFQNLMTPEGNSTNKTFGSPYDWVLWVSGNQMVNSKQEVCGYANYLHILHKIHEDYHPRDQAEKKVRNELMPPASELDYAGIKFVPGTGDDLFEFKFTEPKGLLWWCRRAHFEIPALGIYDPTESFLRNLIAFEQCLPGVSQHFTSYAFLMDMLVNADKDVQVLEKARVVHNYLGASEEAADLFNKLCKEAALGEFLFADPCNKAAKYSKRCWPKNMADLKRTYFASPWTFIAFCLAFIVFGITVTQFVFSFPLYKRG